MFDNVRSNVPHMLLDDVFTAKEEIANSVKEELVSCVYAERAAFKGHSTARGMSHHPVPSVIQHQSSQRPPPKEKCP